jgi:hypothetical protein
MPKYWIHAKHKIFILPLFMFFLDVFEVPEHDKAIKNLVSVCLCVSVGHHDYSTFSLYYRGRDDAKIFVILIRWTDKLLSFCAWQFRDVRDKNVTFSGYFWVFFSTFLLFLWIVERINVVADVYAHLLVYHTYRVSAPITWRAWQYATFSLFWDFFNFFDIFVDCWAHICCSWRQCCYCTSFVTYVTKT